MKTPIILSKQQIRNRTLRAFAVFFVMIGLAVGGWKWLYHQPENNNIPTPLRAVLDANEKLFTNSYKNDKKSKEYPVSAAVPKARANGFVGLKDEVDTATWRLKVVRKNGDTLSISLAQIMALPKTDVVFDFKCIEGWSQVTYWSGVRYTDFIHHFNLDQEATAAYVGLNTPDKEYYVGIDAPSMRQKQTILCYQLNGKTLPMNQGYPLRLIIPVKYGIKHLKRIGTLFFSNQRPPDYWYERGYDYYSGL